MENLWCLGRWKIAGIPSWSSEQEVGSRLFPSPCSLSTVFLTQGEKER